MTKQNLQGMSIFTLSLVIGFVLSLGVATIFKDVLVYKLHSYTNTHSATVRNNYDDELEDESSAVQAVATATGCGCASCCSVTTL